MLKKILLKFFNNMKINSISMQTKNNYSFKSNRRDVFASSDNSNLKYSNYTYFFRRDLSDKDSINTWFDFRKFIADFYNLAKKVNVYNFASSDGSEDYSLIVSLLEELGNNAKKFFPIKAYDLDSYIVNLAKNAKIGCDWYDIRSINANTNNCLEKYFNLSERRDIKPFFLISPKDEIKDCVNFSVANLMDKVDEIEQSNSLVMCRNVWKYIDETDRKILIEKLSNKLKSTSALVIGEFDLIREVAVDKKLVESGFKRVSDFVFINNKMP